jgi:hypothetical protein
MVTAMNLLIWASKIYIPTSIKNAKLKELARITAEAFGSAAPELRASSYVANLREYALFTQNAAEKATAEKQNIEAIKIRLYDEAYQIGLEIRAALKPKSPNDISSLISLIYQILHINFKVNIRGETIINKCFFSEYYSRETCLLISALDKGMVAGISNGWQLDFAQRITEGFDCCRGSLKISMGPK